jgi:L-lactate dehydrogenase complex protein LldE
VPAGDVALPQEALHRVTTIFATCLVDTVRPSVVDATRRVLARLGVAATVARWATCCGQPAWNAGYASDARRVAGRTVRALARTEGPIVVPSGSCATMMRHHWPAVFAGSRHEAAAHAVTARVQELTELCARLPPPAPPSDRAPAGEPVAYHDSCHLRRGLRVGDAPRVVLAASGHEPREPEGADRCCGFGGTVAVKLAGVSVAMADEKLDSLCATGATTVTGCDLSCLLHLEGRARRRAMPLRFRPVAEVLDAEVLDGD